jgi:hypothetical protein
MKEKIIRIRIDEETGTVGFLIEQDKGNSNDVKEILELVGLLEHLKQIQLNKIPVKGRFLADKK